jgi:sugar lactone lactonase YvrE
MESLGAYGGQKRWRSPDRKRLYTWDSLHGEIEAWNTRGRHLGAMDAVTGVFIKGAKKGRRIHV